MIVKYGNESLPMYAISNGSGKDNVDDGGESQADKVAHILWLYIGPLIFGTGLVGNILAFLVIRRKKLSGTTTSKYLQFLAIADIVVLCVGLLPDWLEQNKIIDIKSVHEAMCKIQKYLFYTSSDVSIFLLVSFTFDRMFAVCFPFKSKEISVPKRVKFVALFWIIILTGKNLNVFWTRGAEYKTEDGKLVLYKVCGRPTPEYKYFSKFVRPWIVLVVSNIIPLVVILICNILIIRALFVSQRMRDVKFKDSSQGKIFMQMTFMCLFVSFAFAVCVTPSVILYVGKPYWAFDPATKDAYTVSKAANNLLVYVNHSINFFMYCLSGKRFRHELVSLFCKRRGHTMLGQSFDSTDPMASERKGSVSVTYVHKVNNHDSCRMSSL